MTRKVVQIAASVVYENTLMLTVLDNEGRVYTGKKRLDGNWEWDKVPLPGGLRA